MRRQADLDEISDGRLYTLNDMVKADCQDCAGCWSCCQGMGESIVLDPMDIYRLEAGLHLGFEELLAGGVELHVVDGIILPNLKMTGEAERCAYLNEAGRCSIHPYRPGICRLFPLGRVYEDGTFRYFLQVHECRKSNRTKIKVKKWLDLPDVSRYDQYISDWHFFIRPIQDQVSDIRNETAVKTICMSILKVFYLEPYDTEESFYPQFYRRLEENRLSLQEFLSCL